MGARSLSLLNRDLGHGIAGKKNKFDAPEDYAPGKADDLLKGYHRGSFIMNEDRDLFICLHESEGEAIWMKLEGVLTKESYAPDQEVEGVKAPAEKREPDLEDAGEVTKDHFEELKKEDSDKFQPKATAGTKEETPETSPEESASLDDGMTIVDSSQEPSPEAQVEKERKAFSIGVDAAPDKTETAIPTDMPWNKFLLKAGYKYIEEVEKLSADNIADISYLNEKRAKDIIEWLTPVKA